MDSIPKITRGEFKAYQKLLLKKYRLTDGKYIIEGPHLVEEALTSDWKIGAILLSASSIVKNNFVEIQKRAGQLQIPLAEIADKELDALSDTLNSQGILAIIEIPSRVPSELLNVSAKSSIIVALDAVTDPGNMGTILRTCDWFGVDAVVVGAGSVDIFNPKVVRSTMGALFHLPVYWDVDLSGFLRSGKKKGYEVVMAVLKNGKNVKGKSFSEKCILVFGNEAHGISDEVLKEAEDRIIIDKFGKAESLNVAISCGILLSFLRLRP